MPVPQEKSAFTKVGCTPTKPAATQYSACNVSTWFSVFTDQASDLVTLLLAVHLYNPETPCKEHQGVRGHLRR